MSPATALAAGAVGILIPKTRRLAGGLTGIMIFSWVFLVHLPRAIQFFGAQGGNETTAMFEAGVQRHGVHHRRQPRAVKCRRAT